MESSNLFGLPPELLIEIITLLPVSDILRCKQLCRSISSLIDASVEIQYKIQLFFSRQRHIFSEDHSMLSVSDRLETLKSVDENWANLNFVRHSTLAYPYPSSYVYELSGGRLVLGSGTASGINGTSAIDIYDLPSRDGMRDISPRKLSLEFSIADFAMDVTQNLLVLIERTLEFGINIHLHTFDTNVLHPDAQKPLLHIPNQKWVTVHISGPVLACLFSESTADILTVWNWKSGDEIAHLAGAKMRSFSMLSPDSLVVANLDQEALDVYKLDMEGKMFHNFHRLQLPRVSGDEDPTIWTYDHALLRSHPNPRHPSQSDTYPNNANRQTNLPFITDDEDGIIACTFHSATAQSSFTLVTHRTALLRIYNPEQPPRDLIRNGIKEKVRLVPWSDWGPANVRWMDVECSMRWICYVHGHRLVVLEQRVRSEENEDKEDLNITSDEEFTHRTEEWRDDRAFLMRLFESEDNAAFYALRVFDFNPRAVRKASLDKSTKTMPPQTRQKDRIGKGPLLVTDMTLTNRKIITRLPYMDTTVKLRKVGLGEKKKRKRIEGVMMNGDCVIVMMADRNFHTDGVEVLNV